MSSQKKPRSFLAKVYWVIRYRPRHIWSWIRTFYFFYTAWLGRKFFGAKGIELGENVRLQRNRCLTADGPGAKVIVGRDAVIYEKANVAAYGDAVLEIGEGSVLGDIRIVARYGIKIGARFLSSWNVFIQDYDPHPVDPDLRRLQMEELVDGLRPRFGSPPIRGSRPALSALWNFPGREIVIGDDVWVGANATILKGARIGNGCIIGTGSVVLKGEYPDRSVLAGNPARVVKTLELGEVARLRAGQGGAL